MDTSALVKRYTREQGSTWIVSLMARRAGHDLYTVRLTGPEAIAALARKARTSALTPADTARSSRAFRCHWHRRLFIVEVAEAIAEHAMDLAERHGLRGYDAVHLAAALVVAETERTMGRPPLTFISADADQRQAAMAEGLVVENPNAYP